MRTNTILIASFDSNVYNELVKELDESRREITFVQRGTRVLQEILERHIDLLILDVELAGMMGTEILPLIKKLRPRLPVILITDDMNKRVRQMAAELGVTYQAFKPISSHETDAIRAATRKIIDRTNFNIAV